MLECTREPRSVLLSDVANETITVFGALFGNPIAAAAPNDVIGENEEVSARA